MSLFYPDADPEVSAPRVHALIIGVGAYPHFEDGSLITTEPATVLRLLGQLTSPPVSAVAFASWMVRNAAHFVVPLGTVELLLAPVPGAALPRTQAAAVEGATFDEIKAAFKRWVTRCDRSPDNIAFFYFCGHGLQAESIYLLPSDFGSDTQNPYDTAIDFLATFDGMSDCKAKLQCYLIDACRETPIELLKASRIGARTLKTTHKLVRPPQDAPVLFAAPQGWQAQGGPNQVSHFTDAVLQAFERLGASRKVGKKWVVRSNTLADAVINGMIRRKGLYCSNEGKSQFQTDIFHMPNPAEVMADVVCDPQEAHTIAQIYCEQSKTRHDRALFGPDPWNLDLIAGDWRVGADFPPGSRYLPVPPQLEVVHPPLSSPRILAQKKTILIPQNSPSIQVGP